MDQDKKPIEATEDQNLSVEQFLKPYYDGQQKIREFPQGFRTQSLTISARVHTLFDLSKFKYLCQIWLNHNNISSIQSICHMKMPNLKKFSVSYNKIVKFNSFRKINQPLLNQVQFDHNLIIEGIKFEELYFFPGFNPANLSFWLFFSEKKECLQSEKICDVIDAKFRPLKIKIRR